MTTAHLDPYQPLTDNDLRAITRYGTVTDPWWDVIDCADEPFYYEPVPGVDLTPQDYCRLGREALARIAEAVAILADDLRVGPDGMYAAASDGADLFLEAQRLTLTERGDRIRRVMLDALLGPVDVDWLATVSPLASGVPA